MSEEQIAEEVTEESVNEEVEEANEDVEQEAGGEETESSEEESTEEAEQDNKDSDEGKEAPKRYVLKAYDKEYEVSAEQYKDLAEQGLVAGQKFKEINKKEKELVQVINDLKDPSKVFSLLEKMGHDTRKITEDFLWDKVQEEKMTEEQKEALQWKRKAEALEAAQNQQKKERETRDLAVRQKELQAEYEKSFTEALSDVEIPKTNETVAKMAYYMEAALIEGAQITAKDAALLVQQDMANYYKDLAEKANPEQLVSLFGENLATKLKNYDLGKIKSPTDDNKVGKVKAPIPKIKGTKKKNPQEYKKMLDERFGGDPWDEA